MLPPSLPPPPLDVLLLLLLDESLLSDPPQAAAPNPTRQAAASAAASRVPLLGILRPSFLQDLARNHRYVRAGATDRQVRPARGGRVTGCGAQDPAARLPAPGA